MPSILEHNVCGKCRRPRQPRALPVPGKWEARTVRKLPPQPPPSKRVAVDEPPSFSAFPPAAKSQKLDTAPLDRRESVSASSSQPSDLGPLSKGEASLPQNAPPEVAAPEDPEFWLRYYMAKNPDKIAYVSARTGLRKLPFDLSPEEEANIKLPSGGEVFFRHSHPGELPIFFDSVDSEVVEIEALPGTALIFDAEVCEPPYFANNIPAEKKLQAAAGGATLREAYTLEGLKEHIWSPLNWKTKLSPQPELLTPGTTGMPMQGNPYLNRGPWGVFGDSSVQFNYMKEDGRTKSKKKPCTFEAEFQSLMSMMSSHGSN